MNPSKQQLLALYRYWDINGGPNFLDSRPFRMFDIPKNGETVANIAKDYYGGEKNWLSLIESNVGTIHNVETPFFNIDYIITEIEWGSGDIDRVEVGINPEGTIDVDGQLILNVEDIYKLSDASEFLEKYYPHIEPDTPEYDQRYQELTMNFFDGDSAFIDSLEDTISASLSKIITKPYGPYIDYLVVDYGKKEDFNKQTDMSEQFDRIKTLIGFTDY